jgi:hypothetical protein
MSSEWESSSTVCGSCDSRPSSESTQYDTEKDTLPAPCAGRSYSGSGTLQDPFVVDWDSEEDPENPLNFYNCKKWIITSQVCLIPVASRRPS